MMIYFIKDQLNSIDYHSLGTYLSSSQLKFISIFDFRINKICLGIGTADHLSFSQFSAIQLSISP